MVAAAHATAVGKRVALIHDSFTQGGGAERVAAVLHDMFPTAPIYTLAVDPRILPEGIRNAEFRTSFLQRLPGMPSLGAFKRYLPLLPVAAEGLRPDGFDLVISSSSAFAHGAHVRPEAHVAYIHNTMRFAWDYDDYVAAVDWPSLIKAVGRTAVPWLKAWDRAAGRRPRRLLANSRTVAARIAQRWGRQAEVLAPPVDLTQARTGGATRGHFCVVSRLVPYKRIDVAVAAANLTGEPLMVVGGGPDLPRLRSMAGPSVHFLGPVSDADKWRVLGDAVALITPGIEDFGIAPVEANAAGTPVIAPAAGGVLDTQISDVTALLLSESTPPAIAAAMRRARSRQWDRPALAAHAQQFSTEAFRRRLSALLARADGAA